MNAWLFNPFGAVCVGRGGGELVGSVQSRGLGARASPSRVYPTGGLHCGAVEGLAGCVQGRELGGRALFFEVCPAGKLQWHFTCGFEFRHYKLANKNTPIRMVSRKLVIFQINSHFKEHFRTLTFERWLSRLP